jgi:hypothetical protein
MRNSVSGSIDQMTEAFADGFAQYSARADATLVEQVFQIIEELIEIVIGVVVDVVGVFVQFVADVPQLVSDATAGIAKNECAPQ